MVSLGTGVLAAVLWFSLIQGQLDAVKSKSAKLREEEEKDKKAALLIQKSAYYKEELALLSKAVEDIEAGMASGGMPWIYKIIPNFVETRHRNVVLSDVSSGPRNTEVGFVARFPYQAVTYSIELTARYQDFGVFLADFENQFPYMRVQSLDVGPPRKSAPGDEEKLGFRLDIVALVKPGVSP